VKFNKFVPVLRNANFSKAEPFFGGQAYDMMMEMGLQRMAMNISFYDFIKMDKNATECELRERINELRHAARKDAESGHGRKSRLAKHTIKMLDTIASVLLDETARDRYDHLVLGLRGKTEAIEDALIRFGDMAMTTRQIDRALAYYERAANLGCVKGMVKAGLAARETKCEDGYEKSAFWMNKAASLGDADAQYHLGMFYGEGLKGEDYPKMVDWQIFWLEKAHRQKHHLAQNALGLIYQHGHGVDVDENQAFFYFSRAAENGNADAMVHIGQMHLNVKKDHEMAMRWFKDAAKRNHAMAMTAIGQMIEKKEATDDRDAMFWYEKAMALGEPLAFYRAGAIFFHERIYEDAFKMFAIAADKGVAKAFFALGVMTEHGHGVKMDIEMATRYYVRSAQLGFAKAQCLIGIIYEKDDPVAAAHWYMKASENGHVDAQIRLGRMYAEGSGMPQNDEKALMWLERAAQSKDGKALCQLAYFHFKRGRVKECLVPLNESINTGYVLAEYLMGMVHMEENKTEAMFWLESAARKGCAPAQHQIGLVRLEEGNLIAAMKMFQMAIGQGYAESVRKVESMRSLRRT
jgi:TPR repeat protein